MFVIVRDELCGLYKRCPELWEDDNPPAEVTDAMCEETMGDPSAYESPIDEARRTELDACLDTLEQADCGSLLGTEDLPPACVGVSDLLDL